MGFVRLRAEIERTMSCHIQSSPLREEHTTDHFTYHSIYHSTDHSAATSRRSKSRPGAPRHVRVPVKRSFPRSLHHVFPDFAHASVHKKKPDFE